MGLHKGSDTNEGIFKEESIMFIISPLKYPMLLSFISKNANLNFRILGLTDVMTKNQCSVLEIWDERQS